MLICNYNLLIYIKNEEKYFIIFCTRCTEGDQPINNKLSHYIKKDPQQNNKKPTLYYYMIQDFIIFYLRLVRKIFFFLQDMHGVLLLHYGGVVYQIFHVCNTIIFYVLNSSYTII